MTLLHPRSTLEASLLVALLSCAVSTVGCQPVSLTTGTSGEPRSDRSAGPVPGAPTGPDAIWPQMPEDPESLPQIRAVRLRLYTLEVPVGKISGTEEIWSYLNEQALGARKNLTLGLNGLRVGLGRGEDWPDVADAISRLTGRKLAESQSQLLPGRTTHVRLKKDAAPRSIFLFRQDRTLTGQDVPFGDYVMTFTCGINPHKTGEVLLTGLPQLRTVIDVPKPYRQDGVVGWERGPRFDSFDPALFQLSVPDKGFVLMGPGSQSRRTSSLGRHLLVKQRQGMPFETILVIVPELFSAPIVSGRMDR
jgi:hypothetical protein